MSFLEIFKTFPLSFEGKSVELTERELLVKEFLHASSSLPTGGLVCLQEKSPLKFLISFLGLLDRGCIPLALPSDMNEFQMSRVFESLPGASRFIMGVVTLAELPKISSYHDCYACLTSGTTGAPKLCYLSIAKAKDNAKAHCDSLGIQKSDTLIQTLPLYHSFGIVSYIFAWLELGCILDLNSSFLGFNALAKRSLSNAVMYASPAQLRFMLKERAGSPPGLRLVSVGGGSIDQASLEQFHQKAPHLELYTTYGLTEAGPRVSSGRWQNHETGFIGTSLNGVRVKVLRDGSLKHFGNGHLCVASPSLKLNLDSSEMKEEFLVTRDLIEINPKGEIFFKSREDDLINVGGISVYPLDVEAVVKSYPKVLDAIVLKRPSKMYEEEPILFVEPELDIIELNDFLKERLSVYQMPKMIQAMEKLPRTSLHKIDRKALSLLLEKS